MPRKEAEQLASRTKLTGFFFLLSGLALAIAVGGRAMADAGHAHNHNEQQEMLDQMMKMHEGHEHEHSFDSLKEMSQEEMHEAMDLMIELGLAMPPMDSHHGRELFVEKGCVVCHSVNGVGGEVGPSLNAADMPQPMNAFEFAARMWRGAPAMTQMQEQLFGAAIDISGQELADIIAFAHDESEQEELTADQVPERFKGLIP